MASKAKLYDPNISLDEFKHPRDSVKDENSRKLVNNSSEAISEQANRCHFEEDGAQIMEKKRGMDGTLTGAVPSQPEPCIVLKTSTDGGDSEVVISINQSEKIDKPYSERVHSDIGERDLMWHIPYSLAPPMEDSRPGSNKRENWCHLYYFTIHPDTYNIAESNPRVQKQLSDTALNGIEKEFGIMLDRKNVKCQKILSKGTTVIRNLGDSGQQVEQLAQDAGRSEKDLQFTVEQKEGNIDRYEGKQSEDEYKQESLTNTLLHGNASEKSGASVPKYNIVHRFEKGVQKRHDDSDSEPKTRQQELVIKIELPLLKTATEANLDIFEKRLLLESAPPTAYRLDLPLPCSVNNSQGRAKFDKQKRTLMVILPVVPEKSELMSSNNDATDSSTLTTINKEDCLQVLSNEIQCTQESEKLQQSNTSEHFLTQKSYSLPDFSFTQDAKTITFVLKVKNATEDSIQQLSPSSHEVKLLCMAQKESGRDLQLFSLFLRFANNCHVVPGHHSVDATSDNIVLNLLKEPTSQGHWDLFWAGLDSDSLKEHKFLTTSNLQQQLAKLDKASMAADNQATDPAASSSPCELQVTAMNNKKLTIKISRPSKNDKKRKEEDDEDEEYDPPSSAEIEVIHSRPRPCLHSILKQRTVSESSEDINLHSDSPRSPPIEDDDELSSSSGKPRSVSFSKCIDKATFKSSASVNSMKTSLKSKRRRQRKWEEKHDKASSRRRHNSTGSEGSGDDHSHSMSDSHSHSEEEAVAVDDQAETPVLQSVHEHRTNPLDGKINKSDHDDGETHASESSYQ